MQVAGGTTVYAYEVDGMGKSLADFDDPNWPSLVAMPLLGYAKYDNAVYGSTRARLLSPANKYWLEGKDFKGMGSPHTAAGMAWALGTLSELMTADTAEERAEKLRLLLKLQCKDGLMHESINVNNLDSCTRRWFEVSYKAGRMIMTTQFRSKTEPFLLLREVGQCAERHGD